MLDRNVVRILESLQPQEQVLDCGGWWRPFNRANWVIDVMPYETRGVGGFQGPREEHFSASTWVHRDLCAREPFPFRDQQFDFVVCSHTLEDVRDPLFLCAELQRVGKRGYIEVPSIKAELARGVESRHFAGYSHHRWLIDIRAREIEFTHKPHVMHARWRYHLPARVGHALGEEERVQFLFWEAGFRYTETFVIDYEKTLARLDALVRATSAYPSWRYRLDGARELGKRLRGRVRRSAPAPLVREASC